MSILITTVVSMLGIQGVRAIYMSLKKERTMVAEGGEVLPFSVWFVLGLEVVLNPIFAYIMLCDLQEYRTLILDSTMTIIATVVLTYIVVAFTTRVIIVLLITIIKYFYIKRIKKAYSNKESVDVFEEVD